MPVWIVAIQWLSWSVLALLVALSIWSVATMLGCSRLLNKADCQPGGRNDELGQVSQWIESRQWQLFREWAAKGETLPAGAARVILQTSSNEASLIDRAVKSYLSLERNRLDNGCSPVEY